MPTQQRTTAKAVVFIFLYYTKEVRTQSKELKEPEKAKKLSEKVYREAEAKINTADEGGVRYSFSGAKSKTYDFAALEKAIRPEDVGKATSEEIRQQTGWFRGYDGKTQAYSYMKNGHNRTAPTILYEKEIGDKSYYVIQDVPETKKNSVYCYSVHR